MKSEFLTPVGRLVQGDPFEAQTKNMQGQPLMTQGGQPTQRYFIAVAFKKDDPAFAQLWGAIEQVGRGSFPALNIAPPWDPACRFSWKVMDGDGVDDNGKPNANKPGFAGHWIVKFSSSFPPKCFYAGRYAPHEQITDPKAIPRGYYVRVAGTIEGNANPQKPGVYVNLNMVELAGGSASDVIVVGPDAASVFGGAPVQLPPGVSAALPAASAAPLGLPGAALPTLGIPASTVPATGVPVIAAASPGLPVIVKPNPGILGTLPSLAPAEPALTQAAKDAGLTYASMKAQGYDDATLRAGGYII